MITVLPYIIKVQICFALLWITYRLFIEKGKVFSMSRAYLLCSAVVAFVLPLVSVPVYQYANNTAVYIQEIFEVVSMQTVAVSETTANRGSDLHMVCVWMALAGSTALLLRMTVNIVALRILSRKGRREKSEGVNIIYTCGSSVAFSLFNNIYMNITGLSVSQVKQVLSHELCHVRLGHSWDMMLSALMRILFWWNPFVWLWSRSLVEVHEFQADEAVLNNGSDQAQYINLIVQKLADGYPEFVSGFSYSLIKKRLKMITKNSRSRFAGLRILAVLPVALFLPVFFACAEVDNQQKAPLEIAVSQNIPKEEPVNITVNETGNEQKAVEVNIKVETMPEFPGGDKAFQRFLVQNLRFPTSLMDTEINQTVITRFIVDATGKIKDVENANIGESINELLKAEAIRVIKSMPDWIPGRQDGKAVSVMLQQSIMFQKTMENIAQIIIRDSNQ